MKITCLHGYTKFEEQRIGELAEFMRFFGVVLARAGDHFTFEDLIEAPDYSIAGGEFLGCPTTETFEGPPWEVMRANGIVYDFSKGAVVPIETIVQSVQLSNAGTYYFANGMILPGSLTDEGKRVTDYAAFFNLGSMRVLYSEVESE